MMKQFKKVLSILCALALLLSSLAMALAEGDQIENAAPAEVSTEIPAEVPAEVPAEIPAEAPAEAPVAAPAEEPAEAPAEVPAEAPVVEVPAEAPAEVPAEAPAEVPAEPANEVPAEAPAEVKAEDPAEVPAAEAPAETPAQVQEDVPTEAPAEAPVVSDAEEQTEVPAETPAAEEDASDDGEDDPDGDGFVEFGDEWGDVEEDTLKTNAPEMTDELKGLRYAEMSVGQTLNDSVDFGDTLVITLKKSDAKTIVLTLYTTSKNAPKVLVDGKNIGFTPAENEDPSINVFTAEVKNTAGRAHEIILESTDKIVFSLNAAEKQAEAKETTEEENNNNNIEENPAEESGEQNNEPAEIPAEENTEVPAEEPTANTSTETPAETPAPTVEVSVKTYDALKPGNSISDTLVAGQKAKIQLKCGRNENVTLVLGGNTDDLDVSIDGAAFNGNTCELQNIAFRKFNIVITAKQDASFILSASAVNTAEEAAEEETEEPAENVTEEPAEEISEEENSEEITEEETEEEPAEEVTEETAEEEQAEEVSEEGEETEEAVEVIDEEKDDETEASDEEMTEVETSEETVEETAEETEEEIEEVTEEEATEEELAEEEEIEEIELLSDEQMVELGYRKIQILNKNGADVYAAAEENASVTGHADFETELWIKDIEAEGWAQIYTAEGEEEQFILLAEIEKQLPTDEEMLAKGYIKVYVGIDIGANVYAGLGSSETAVDHLDAGIELWVKLIDGADRAQIINPEDESAIGYVNLVDIIAIMKPEGMENLPTREIVLHDVFKEFGMNVIFLGTEVPFELELINFAEDDCYVVNWQYSVDGEEFIDIPDAHDLTFTYIADTENQNYFWKAIVKLVTVE